MKTTTETQRHRETKISEPRRHEDTRKGTKTKLVARKAGEGMLLFFRVFVSSWFRFPFFSVSLVRQAKPGPSRELKGVHHVVVRLTCSQSSV
ncbi:MAG: hypothetical protein OEM59_21570, partial [Rhodospirillales bacterium]|nr:hypothetical protein [Rhodospirillales bacterium]